MPKRKSEPTEEELARHATEIWLHTYEPVAGPGGEWREIEGMVGEYRDTQCACGAKARESRPAEGEPKRSL
jgi:hypothetical protein